MQGFLKLSGLSRGLGRLLMFGAFCGASAGVVLLFLFVLPLRVLYTGEYWLQDRLMEMPLARSTPVNEDFVLMAIDQPSMTLDQVSDEEIAASRGLELMSGGFPWPREIYAHLLDRILGEGEARLVLVDVFFASDSGMDGAFKDALDRYADRVVIASKFEAWSATQEGADLFTLNLPSESILPNAGGADPRVGYVTFFAELDDKVRTVQLETTLEGVNRRPEPPGSQWYRSLTAAALAMLGRDELLVKRRDPTPYRFTRMSADTYRPRSMYELFLEDTWERNYGSGEFFKDKIVFIGPSATTFQDYHTGPFGRMLGVHFHMNALAAMLAGETYERSSTKTGGWLVVLMAVLAGLLVESIKAPLRRLFGLLAAAFCYLGGAILLLNEWNLLITCMAPLAAYTSSGVLCFGYDLALRAVKDLRVRRALERYVSKDLAHEILENREDYMSSLGGTDKKMTMLFSDIRGFTTITEQMGGRELVPKLNEYLKEMVECVFEFHGTLDKFIGDAVMAVWGSVKTEGPKTDAVNAVNSALAMQRRLAELNKRWAEEDKEPFHIGIGLHSGHAIFGNVGSDERMDPTVIGDAVNLAARLEGLTKEYRCGILVSESVAEYVREEFVLRSVDLVVVKGKSEAVEIFSVLGPVKEIGTMPKWLAKYEEGVRAFRARDFSEAVECFGDVLEMHPGDPLADRYLENTKAFIVEAPPENWEGVTVMTTK